MPTAAQRAFTDSQNLSGATRVYEDCGFVVARRNCVYRKPLLLSGADGH
jgi:hypothetical protein